MRSPCSSARSRETSRTELPDLHERLEAELIASAWWTPETFPLAQERLAALDLDALHGGFGSDLLLADAPFYQGRLAADREAATRGRARRARLGRARRERRARLPLRRVRARQRRALLDEAIAAYDAAPRGRAGAATSSGGTLHAFRGRAKMLRGDLEAALADLREGLELIVVAQGVDTAVPYAVSFLAQALLERGELDEAAAVVAARGPAGRGCP